MLTENLPLSLYVKMMFQDKKVLKTIENWPLEPETLEKIVISTIEEMGIYEVTPKLEGDMLDIIIDIIKKSPDILDLLKKAQEAEKRRKSNRYYDGHNR